MKAFVLAALLLAGCATGGGGSRLGEGDWAAADLNGVPVTGTPPTMRLADNRAGGSTGCNTWSTDYRLRSREGISFGPVVTTRMSCPEPQMEQERRFLSILEQVQGYSVYGDGSVSLIAPDGRAIRFRPR